MSNTRNKTTDLESKRRRKQVDMMTAFLNAFPITISAFTGASSNNFNKTKTKSDDSYMSGTGCPFLRMCPFLRGRVIRPHPISNHCEKGDHHVGGNGNGNGSNGVWMDVKHNKTCYVEEGGDKNAIDRNNVERKKRDTKTEKGSEKLFEGNGNGGVFRVDPNLVQQESEENLRGFIKTRGSLIPGEEFVFWWTGDIFGMNDEGTSKHLFAFEGYNIGRMMCVDGGWRMLTREVGLYKDAKTREIIHGNWLNPITGKTNHVVHVWNDPVNQQFLLNNPHGKFKVPTTDGGDDLYFHAEVFLKYPSPLPKSKFPDQANSEDYQSAEMFQFFTKKEDLIKDEPSANCQISWVRVGQWLPWMEMGDKPGRMVYHCRGKKLKHGYSDLSPKVRAFIEKEHPEYAQAPSNFKTPNETSWTYFRKLLDAKGTPRADGRIAYPEPESDIPAPAVVHLTDNNQIAVTKEKVEGLKEFSEAELSTYNGCDPKKPIYLSIGGSVFDVSSARRHYRFGETYNCLVGRDATGAFIAGDLSEKGMTKFNMDTVRENLSDEGKRNLENWLDFFAQKYPIVGSLVKKRSTDVGHV